MNVLLAYVAYPATTAFYLERALRAFNQVTTIGPKLPEQLISTWNLQNLKEPIKSHDIEVSMNIDMASMLHQAALQQADFYLWVESVPGYFPNNLKSIKCPKACYLIDTYRNHAWHLEWAKNFDFVFLADLSFVEKFRSLGINAHWLPLGCDPEIHIATNLTKKYDIGFVGTVSKDTVRYNYLTAISSKFKLHYERSFLKEMAQTFGHSKIVFNNAVGNTDLNMRFFEAMSCGTLLLSDMAKNSGQDIMFMPHYDYALYNEKNILDVVDYYLKDDVAREAVSSRGREIVHSVHTYRHRVEKLLDVVSGKEKTTPNPYDWRDQSLATIYERKNPGHLIDRNSIQRSFIIPVLDYSPASPYNIKSLLANLEDISGDVIVIFNNEKVAEELKSHPRINHYAILNKNVGVSRAWNLGLEICQTDYAFILNADLSLKKSTIDLLQVALKELPQAAIVGPQGSYFNFEELKDYIYLDKNTFNSIMEVDAVSGFLFGVNTKYFKNKILKFENAYSPCYYEEWDIGLQAKLAGLKSYVIPTTDYDHQWSGSIRAYRQIQYYDRKETSKQIHFRNGHLFQEKWRQLAIENPEKSLLESAWLVILKKQIEIAISRQEFEQGRLFLDRLKMQFPDDSSINQYKTRLFL